MLLVVSGNVSRNYVTRCLMCQSLASYALGHWSQRELRLDLFKCSAVIVPADLAGGRTEEL